MYEIFEHTADLGVRVHAAGLPDLFAEAGRAVLEVIAGDPGQVRLYEEVSFEIAGTDPEWLLLDWLAEVLAAFDLKRLLLAEFEVTITPAGLRATARGERYDPSRHVLAHEVKAVTQHEFDLHETPAGWEATFILDI
ncbi:MAG: archease [Planctomycetota bacterium]